MSSTMFYPGLRSPKILIPISTALLGALGFSTGLQAFLSPGVESAKMFGIDPPTRVDSNSEADARQRAYIQIHGIRNMSNGIAVTSLVAFWRFSTTCQMNLSAAHAIQKALAILMASGIMVGIADGLIIKKYLQASGIQPQAKEYGNERSLGHIGFGAIIFGLAAGWWLL